MPSDHERGSERPRLPPTSRGSEPPAATPASTGLPLALALGGIGLLVLTAAAIVARSTHRDGVQVALAFAALITVGLAFAFETLAARHARTTAVLESGLIVAGFLVLFLLIPHDPFFYSDDGTRFGDLEALLHGGRISNSPYSLVMPLASAPVLALGNVVESRTWWAGHVNVVFLALGVAIALRLVRGCVDPRLARRAVLALMFASFVTERLRDYNAEVFTATLVALGILGLASGRHQVVWWGAIVVGVVNSPATGAGLALVALAEVVRTRRLRYLAPVVVAAGLIMLEAWIRRGSPLATGYAGNHGLHTVMPYSGLPDFSYPFLLGVAAILFSFGRGLLFFTPGLTLWLDRRTRKQVPGRRAVTMLLLFTLGLVLVYAKWWAWYGGISWGPRFFLVATVPASILIATRVMHAGASPRADAFALGVLILSAWGACAGAVATLTALNLYCGGAAYENEQLCWFTPDFSSLWQSVRQFPPLTTETTIAALYIGLVFAYLAAPLVTGLVRALRPRGALLAGWRV